MPHHIAKQTFVGTFAQRSSRQTLYKKTNQKKSQPAMDGIFTEFHTIRPSVAFETQYIMFFYK